MTLVSTSRLVSGKSGRAGVAASLGMKSEAGHAENMSEAVGVRAKVPQRISGEAGRGAVGRARPGRGLVGPGQLRHVLL